MPVDPSNNISGFVNAFAGGGVRTNLFVVNGTIPGYSDNRAISFLCKAAQIPASSLGTIASSMSLAKPSPTPVPRHPPKLDLVPSAHLRS